MSLQHSEVVQYSTLTRDCIEDFHVSCHGMQLSSQLRLLAQDHLTFVLQSREEDEEVVEALERDFTMSHGSRRVQRAADLDGLTRSWCPRYRDFVYKETAETGK
eukprot:sb/3478137/